MVLGAKYAISSLDAVRRNFWSVRMTTENGHFVLIQAENAGSGMYRYPESGRFILWLVWELGVDAREGISLCDFSMGTLEDAIGNREFIVRRAFVRI